MIYLVGMGPGHSDYLTQKAIQVIKEVDKCVAFGRISETARQITHHVTTVNKLEDIVKNLKHKGEVALLASGDACFFGILDFLKSKQVHIDQVIPGITSFQYMMNRLQISWQGAACYSLHGRNQNYYEILNSELSIILTDKQNSPAVISRKLSEHGGKGKIYVGFNLSYENEVILEKEIGDPIPDVSSLATIIMEIEEPDAA